MNPVTDFIFTVSWFALLFFAVRSIIKGWSLMTTSSLKSKSTINVENRIVTKSIHPEMADVKQGDQLMVVNFEDKDPLYKSLQERIDDIENDEEDDDGDVVVRL